MANHNEAVKMYDTVLSLQTMNTDCIDQAKKLFCEYKERGIILNSEFSDDKWNFSDEYSHVGIVFTVNKFAYRRYYQDYFVIADDIFIDYLKTYVLLTMGDLALKALQNIVNDVKRLINTDPDQLFTINQEVYLSTPNRVIEFFSILPEMDSPEKVDKLMDALDLMADLHHSCINQKKRPLASFDSYFLFNDIMNDYWSSVIPENERLFFYPLYLWWQITGVIPLRPREFILTPRNCLEQKKDGWYITLRRNQLKGADKKISYRIKDDYFTVQYKIPDKLAGAIREYIEFTKKYESTELQTLFITDTHYLQWHQKKHSNSRFFTYVNLNCVMRYFFHDVIEGRYGLRIIYDRDIKHLEDGCINYLYLGDTRHLALINIIAEGGTPVLAMMLAGHDNIEMSAHYYSNITSLIECRTYKQYRKVLKGNVSYEISRNMPQRLNIRDFTDLDDGGRCYSSAFFHNDYSECKKVSGPEGEIGYCPDCMYYRKDRASGFFKNDDIYKRKIEDDCKRLEQVVRQVRIEKGNPETILQAMLRLQNSSYTYQQYYMEKLLVQKEESGATES